MSMFTTPIDDGWTAIQIEGTMPIEQLIVELQRIAPGTELEYCLIRRKKNHDTVPVPSVEAEAGETAQGVESSVDKADVEAGRRIGIVGGIGSRTWSPAADQRAWEEWEERFVKRWVDMNAAERNAYLTEPHDSGSEEGTP